MSTPQPPPAGDTELSPLWSGARGRENSLTSYRVFFHWRFAMFIKVAANVET